MPVTQNVPSTQSHILPPKDAPSPPKQPPVEPVRPTSAPTIIPESPRRRPKPTEPESAPVKSAPSAPRSPTPVVVTSESDSDSDSDPDEQDDADASQLGMVDLEIFNQILELDEDEETHDFSQPMVWDYFEQAERTFKQMDDMIIAKNLSQLSQLGHFLKGSSAALGLSRVQDSCEKIQHYGHQRDEATNKDLTPTEALSRITKTMTRVKVDYAEARLWLKDFYGDQEA